MIPVLLDSSFIMHSAIFHGDIFEEMENVIGKKAETVVLTPIYREIHKIAQKKGLKVNQQAKRALDYIERKKVKIIDVKLLSNETVDDLILRFARTSKCYVATNDKELRKKLVKVEVPVIYIRQRNRLEVSGRLY